MRRWCLIGEASALPARSTNGSYRRPGTAGPVSMSATAGLTLGRSFTTAGGRRGRVDELLGAGGQGECYRVTLDGIPLALKWYHPHYVLVDTGLRARLDRAVRRGAPASDFLWPLDLVDIPDSASFGYLMPLRAGHFVSIRDLIAPPPRRLALSLPMRATVCLHLARSFLDLHASGFCYQDINFGNIFLDPATGAVLICDNDNVNVDGAEASIYGTRKFMAPEIVRRDALPDSRTDLFSMAVLFFYILFGWHPLDGRREAAVAVLDAAAEARLYGTEPLFLFDPADEGNGPVAGFHDAIVARWRSLPQSLCALFTRAFGAGLRDPSARVLETEWRTALRTVADATFSCGGCGFEHVADAGGAVASLAQDCLACAAAIKPPLLLVVGGRALVLDEGRAIAGDALDRRSMLPVGARVEAHPRRPGVFGLRNLGDTPWRMTLPDGTIHAVAAGQAARIMPGVAIAFGRASGTIVGRAA